MVNSLAVAFLLTTLQCYVAYKVPTPNIMVFHPQGFSVSIPDVKGIRLFAFHANFNKRIKVGATGDYYKQVINQTNGKWSFVDNTQKINLGDTICYWVTVVKDRESHRLIANFTVTGLVHLNLNNPRGCEGTVEKLEAQVKNLQKEKSILINLLEKNRDAKKLTMSGRLPPDGSAIGTVTFIIREKLDISPTITSAVRNDDGIVFEVADVQDKLKILAVAEEKLSESKIVIA